MLRSSPVVATVAACACRLRRSWSDRIAVLLAVVVGGLAASVGNAQTSYWQSTSPGNFLTSSNWNGGTPNGVGRTAVIGDRRDVDESDDLPTAAGNFTLNGSMTIGRLVYLNHRGGGIAQRRLEGSGTLTFQEVGDGEASFWVEDSSSGSYLDLWVSSVVLNSTTNFEIDTGPGVYIGSPISGSGGLRKTGDDELHLLGVNTYAGGTLIEEGTLRLSNSSSNIPDSSAVTVSSGVTLDLGSFSEVIGSLAGAGSVTLGSGVLITGGNNSSTTFSGVISGAANSSLQKVGSGTLTLSGDNTYAGSTAILGGSLRLGSNDRISNFSDVTVGSGGAFNLNNFNEFIGSLSGTGVVTLGSGTLTTGNNNNTTTFSGIISGTGGLTKTGTGTFTLSGANTYTGPTTISQGTLRLGSTGNLITTSSAVTVSSAATFDLNGTSEDIGSLSGAGSVNLGSGGSLATGFDNTSTTFSGVIIGTGGLTKAGTGTFTLSGANTYNGPTTISAGTLRLGNSNSNIPDNSAVTVSSGATFDLNNFFPSIASLAGGGSVTLGSGAIFVGSSNSSTTFSGVISGSGSVNKLGTGTFTLSGTNTYSGPTTITSGTLRLGASERISNNSAVTVSSGGTFDLNNFNETIGSLTGAGSVTLGSGSLSTGSNNSSTTFSGIISGSGGLTKQGTGTFTLSGDNMYIGPTTISSGTLRLGASERISNSSAVTVSSGATFSLNNFNETIASLSGVGNVTLGLGSGGLLSTGLDNTSTNFSGVISGTGGMTKLGTGTFTLSGDNMYAGPTTISAGTLRLGASERISNNSAVTVNTGATFQLNNFNETIGSLAGAGTVALGSGTLLTGGNNSSTAFSGVISGTGGVTKTGTGTFTLGWVNTYTGLTTVSGGTLLLGNSGANTYTGPTQVNAGTLQLGGHERLHNGSVVDLLSAGTFDLNNFNETIGLLTGDGSVTLGTGTLTIEGSTTFAGVISGEGGLNKIGTGTLTLSGDNTYTGPTTISAGTLELGANDRISNNSAVTVSSGAIFNLNNFNETIGSLAGGGNVTLGLGTLAIGGNNLDTTFSGVLNGSVFDDIRGGVEKIGTGTLTLSGVNLYSGPTTISAGTLQLGNSSNNIPNGSPVSISSGATLNLNNFNERIGSLSGDGNVTLGSGTLEIWGSTTFAGVIDGSGGASKGGTGTFTLSGDNTYTGPTTIYEGTLRLGTSDRIADSSQVIVHPGATFDLSNFDETIGSLSSVTTLETSSVTLGSGTLTTGANNGSTLFLGVISGTGSLIKTGTGVFTLGGGNTYTGLTTVEQGTLSVTGSIAGDAVVKSGGILGGTGSIGGVVTVESGGIFAPGASPGTITVGGLELLPASTLEFELGAVVRDRIIVNGNALLGGVFESVATRWLSACRWRVVHVVRGRGRVN